MTVEKWLKKNTTSLSGKTVAVTGTTGGLGKELCRYLARLGANLILLDRNEKRSHAFRDELKQDFPVIDVTCIRLDLAEMDTVRVATDALLSYPVDVFVHNAGAYSIPRHVCDTGFDNVFQINFVSPYYMVRRLLPLLRERGGRVVAVGSIAHNYSVTDPTDVDFSKNHTAASKLYGNAKRYLMFSLYRLFDREERVTLAVTHPGISFTGITAHYPRLIFALIKHPMKVIFMRPRKACLSILRGVFQKTENNEWVGPWLFDVWGYPKKKRLHTASEEEQRFIGETAERIYRDLK